MKFVYLIPSDISDSWHVSDIGRRHKVIAILKRSSRITPLSRFEFQFLFLALKSLKVHVEHAKQVYNADIACAFLLAVCFRASYKPWNTPSYYRQGFAIR